MIVVVFLFSIYRTVAANMSRMRFPRCIAKYDEVTHARDKRNPRGVNQYVSIRLPFALFLPRGQLIKMHHYHQPQQHQLQQQQ